jgi:small-conductance mechanosensitive channel
VTRYFWIFFIFHAVLAAQPNPVNLSPTWWKYFDVPEDQLKINIETFTKKIEQPPANLSKEGQDKRKELVEKILINLKAYLALVEQPAPVKQPPTPYLESYTLEQLLQLNKDLQKELLVLNSRQEEKKETLKHVEAAQERLDKLVINYGDQTSGSEKKYLLGLEILAYKTTIELDRKKTESLNQIIEIQSFIVDHLKNEIQEAVNKLAAPEQSLSKLYDLQQTLKKEWEKQQTSLKTKEADAAFGFSKAPGQEAETLNQYLSQQLLEAEIQESLAENQYLLATIQYSLAQIVQDPEDLDFKTILEKSESFKEQTKLTLLNIDRWQKSSLRAQQRVGQLISQGNEKTPELQSIIDTAEKNLLSLEKLKSSLQDINYLMRVMDKKISQHQGFGQLWSQNVMDWLSTLYEMLGTVFGKTLFYIGQQPVTATGVLRFIAILIASYWISRVVVRGLNQFAQNRKGVQKAVIYRVNRLVKYLILFLGSVIGLVFLGFDLSNLILLAGALGVGLGFGLQTIFNNFISGIIVLFQSQLKIGDYIELESGIRGEIREIKVSSTIILTNDGLEVLVPNSEILNTRIINWTLRDPYRRIRIAFGVDYGTDIDKMKDLVIKSAKKIPHTLIKIGIPEPQVYLEKFGESSIDFELVVWVNERSTRRMRGTKSAYLWAIHTLFKEHGIIVPYPQRDLHIKEKR